MAENTATDKPVTAISPTAARALGLTITAIFTTDPITVSKDTVTAEGNLHNLAERLL